MNRSKKTKQLIKDGLMSVSARKGIGLVTVQDIINEATINRATFYYHYKDKLDLIESITDELLEGLAQNIVIPKEINSFTDIVYPPMLAVFEHVKKHISVYKIILSEKGIMDFSKKMVDIIKTSVGNNFDLLALNNIHVHVHKSFITTYVAGALVTVLMDWIENDLPDEPSELANQMAIVISFGVHEV